MEISIVEIVQLAYPTEFEKGNISFVYDGNVEGGIAIDKWTVANTPKPNIEDLLLLKSEYQQQYDDKIILNKFSDLIQKLLNDTAAQKGYQSSESIASYFNSGNAQWKNEAQAYIIWRDAMLNSAYTLLDNVQNKVVPVPTEQQFLDGLPVIQWP